MIIGGITYIRFTIENANSILNSEWNHIAVVCDGVDVMLYVNG